jgi:hypothetical protein
VTLVALLTTAVCFVAIGLVAAGLGFRMHRAQIHFTWVPEWIFEVGHGVEDLPFITDCMDPVWAVFMQLTQQIKGEEDELLVRACSAEKSATFQDELYEHLERLVAASPDSCRRHQVWHGGHLGTLEARRHGD